MTQPKTPKDERSAEHISRRDVLRTGAAASSVLALGGGTLTGPAGARRNGSLETVVTFPPEQVSGPENVAVDRRGNVYLTVAFAGEIRTLPARKATETGLTRTDTELLAALNPGGGALLGIVAAPRGTLYVALASFVPETHGVWRVSRDGTTERIAALPADGSTLPNGVLLERDGGHLLVTDSFGGAIHRIAIDGEVEPWLDHPLLDPSDSPGGDGLALGANGLALAPDGTVFVANLDFGRIVRVPVDSDGSARTPTVFVEDPDLVGADGIVFDRRSGLYVAVNGQNTLVRIAPNRSVETLATVDDGLDSPSDCAFGRTRGLGRSVFVTNFAQSATPNPSLVRLDVGVPGIIE